MPSYPAYPALPGQPRVAGRLARSPQLAAALAARLTARDRWLLRMLHEHKVLTTTQITQLAFGTTRAATARLTTLYQMRAIDRFRPLAPSGSAPLHFILDEAGAAVLAAEDGITVADLGWRRDRALAIALSPQLSHTTGTNGFFTALAAAARASGGNTALDCWWPERRCAAIWGDLTRPDGYGRWHEQPPRGGPPRTVDFFLEYDNGTENLTRVVAKLAGYARLAERTAIPTPVLFWLPTARREAALRAQLAGPPPHAIPGAATAAAIPGVPTATATPGPGGPAGAVWLGAGGPGPRLRLAQLTAPAVAAPAAGAPQPGELPGGLPWHSPSPMPPPWNALPGTPATKGGSL
jgi:Replication-relaxation